MGQRFRILDPVTGGQTHNVSFTDTEVRKRYVDWERGEPDREWTCLTVLATHAPGIAPAPLESRALSSTNTRVQRPVASDAPPLKLAPDQQKRHESWVRRVLSSVSTRRI